MSFKKLLSLVLVLCMVFSLFPVSAFAEDPAPVEEDEETVEVVEEAETPELTATAEEPEEEPVEEAETPELTATAEEPEEEPVEEPEPDPELSESDADYYVTLYFNYDSQKAVNPQTQADPTTGVPATSLTLLNGVMTEAQEQSVAPNAWQDHTFKGWSWAATGGAHGDVDEGDLHNTKFPNYGEIYVAAQWTADKTYTATLTRGTKAAGPYLPGEGGVGTSDDVTIAALEYGQVLSEDQYGVVNGGEAGYVYNDAEYYVGETKIDMETYQITANTTITVKIPVTQVTVWFWKDKEDIPDRADYTSDPKWEAAKTAAAYAYQTVDYNTTVNKPTTPTEDHRTFKQWNTANDEGEYVVEFPFTNATPSVSVKVKENTDVVASWTVSKVNVTFDPGEGGKVNGQDKLVVPVEYNNVVGFTPDATKDGMTCTYWELDGEYFDLDTEKITEPITLNAKYLATSVKLTYVKSDLDPVEVWPKVSGTAIDHKDQSGAWGSDFTMFTDVTREGYTLAGWWDGETVDDDGKPVPFVFTSVKEGARLTALWTPNEITVTLDPTLVGVTVTFDDGTEAGKAFTPTVAAHYGNELVLYTGGAHSEDPNVVELYELNDIPGYDFLRWEVVVPSATVGGETTYETVTGAGYKLTGNTTVRAVWDQYFTVTLQESDGTKYTGDLSKYAVDGAEEFVFGVVDDTAKTITVYPSLYPVGDDVTLKTLTGILDTEDLVAPAEGGKYFAGFFNGDDEFDFVEDEVTSNLTLKAKRLDYVTVTFNYDGGISQYDPEDEWVPADADVGPLTGYYPKGSTLADIPTLRGNVVDEDDPDDYGPRFLLPVLEKEDKTFDGWYKGTTKFEGSFDANTTLVAGWTTTKLYVTFALDGGTYAYANPDGSPKVIEPDANGKYYVTLLDKPTKADSVFEGWYVAKVDDDGNVVVDDFGNPVPSEDVFPYPEPVEIIEDVTICATWSTPVAKERTATDPESGEGYYATLEDALTRGSDIVVLKDIPPVDAPDHVINFHENNNLNVINLNGKTVDLTQSGLIGNGIAILKNGTVIGGSFKDVIVASGTFEDVDLSMAGKGNIMGGKFRWSDDFLEDISPEVTAEMYVALINDIIEVVTPGKKLKLQTGGYYTPVDCATLTICYDVEDAKEDNAWVIGEFGGYVNVFAGEKTAVPVEIADAIEEDENKFAEWLIYDADADEDAEPEVFTFGGTLTEDTVIYADWIEKNTITFGVYVPELPGLVDWEVSVYSDQLIPEPVEPTEDEYAAMSKSEEKAMRAAWAQIKNEDAFIGWRYNLNDKDVKFGTDKADEDYDIYAAMKNAVIFFGFGNQPVSVLYLDDGETIGDRLPREPKKDGYVFNYWVVGTAEGTTARSQILKTNMVYNAPVLYVYATYSSADWAISSVDERLTNGYSSIPNSNVTFGGTDELALYPVPDPEASPDIGEYYVDQGLTSGSYYLAFEVEAPDGVGALAANPNQVEWSYKMDDGQWSSFNGQLGGYDSINASQHLVMNVYKQVTVDLLKELADAENHTKVYTITLVPTAPADAEAYTGEKVTLTATLDPKNVRMYPGTPGDPEDAEFGLKDYRYKFTVSFEMDGGVAIAPVEYEFGQNFNSKVDQLVFTGLDFKAAYKAYKDALIAGDDEAADEAWDKLFELCGKVKKNNVLNGFGIFVDEEEESFEDPKFVASVLDLDKVGDVWVPAGEGFTVTGDKTVYAMYSPVPVDVYYWDTTGNLVYTDLQQLYGPDVFGLGSELNELDVPEAIAAEYGKDAWYPVLATETEDVPFWQVDKSSKAATAYDMKSEELLADAYLDGDDKFIVEDSDGVYSLHLIRGTERSVDVMFLPEMKIYEADDEEVIDITNAKIDRYTVDKNGDVTFGRIEVPKHTAVDGKIFDGWGLVDADHLTADVNEIKDLKPFDFDKNKDASILTKVLNVDTVEGDLGLVVPGNYVIFVPLYRDIANGKATLYSGSFYFDGMIEMRFNYGFAAENGAVITPDAIADVDGHFVVFRIGDEVIEKIALQDSKSIGNNRFQFSCKLPIVRYTETVNVKVENAEGEEWATVTGKGVEVKGGFDYSLEQYAESKESSKDPLMAALAKTVEDYGIATRLFAGKDVGDLTLSDAVKNLKVEDMTGVNEMTVSTTRPEGVKGSVNVLFDSDNTLIVTFTLGADQYEYTLDGMAFKPEIANGKAVLKVENIAPNHLNDKHTFTICTKGGDGSDTLTVETSVLGYAKRKATSGSENMQNLAKALYLYANAATAYANSK